MITGRSTLSVHAPFELSVSAGRDPAVPASLRTVSDIGIDEADPAARLERQRQALMEWIRQSATTAATTAAANSAAGILTELVDVAFPDPAALRPDAEFLTWIGVVGDPSHPEPGHPDRVAAVKAYVCVHAADGALERVAARWPAVAAMADLLPAEMAEILSVAFSVRADGTTRATLYRPVRPGYEHQVLDTLAATPGAGGGGAGGPLLATGLDRAGLSGLLWKGPVVVSTRRALHDPALSFGVDLSLHGGASTALAVARRAATEVHGTTAHVDRLVSWIATTGTPELTWIGVEAPAGGDIARLSLYGVPVTARVARPPGPGPGPRHRPGTLAPGSSPCATGWAGGPPTGRRRGPGWG